MSSAIKTEEILKLAKYMDTYSEQVRADQKKAKRLLCDAGIYTIKGTLKK